MVPSRWSSIDLTGKTSSNNTFFNDTGGMVSSLCLNRTIGVFVVGGFSHAWLIGVVCLAVIVVVAVEWTLTHGGPLSQLHDNDGVS